MVLRAKPGYDTILRIADALNPFLVILSIVGLFLEYSPLKPWVALPNQIIGLIFVLDFLVRLVSLPLIPYLIRGFGWVDFLASLPGILFMVSNSPILALFKVVRVGRFFRILRILRFLRVFSFMKQMKADSPWIQQRIMQIGVTIVLVFIGGIVATDISSQEILSRPVKASVMEQYDIAGRDPAILAQGLDSAVLYTQNGLVYTTDGQQVPVERWFDILLSDSLMILEVPLEDGVVTPDRTSILPSTGILVYDAGVEAGYHTIMLISLFTLVIMLLVIIFFIGSLFAQDMRIVQLVTDSYDAEDYYLLTAEAEKHRDVNGELTVEEGEPETLSLLKVTGRVAGELDRSPVGGSPFPDTGKSQGADPEETISERLNILTDRVVELADQINHRLEERTRAIAMEAVKASAPAILRYLKAQAGGTKPVPHPRTPTGNPGTTP